MYYEIHENTARLAKTMNSFSDYKSGSATSEYRSTVSEIADYAEKAKERLGDDEARKEKIDYLVGRFAKKYADWVNKYHRIESYCPSVMISGAGNFPIRKKEKQNSWRENHYAAYEKLMNIKSLINSVVNGSSIIKSGDSNAIKELEEKIERLESKQKEMKEGNAYYRKHKTLKGFKDLDDEDAERLDENIQSDVLKRYIPFPAYVLSNNNQNIHRLKGRLEQLKKAKEKPTVETENKYFKMVENTEIMRLQLFFDGKPDEEIRTILKSNAFKWSPKNGCWQRRLNGYSKYAFKKVLKEFERKGI